MESMGILSSARFLDGPSAERGEAKLDTITYNIACIYRGSFKFISKIAPNQALEQKWFFQKTIIIK